MISFWLIALKRLLLLLHVSLPMWYLLYYYFIFPNTTTSFGLYIVSFLACFLYLSPNLIIRWMTWVHSASEPSGWQKLVGSTLVRLFRLQLTQQPTRACCFFGGVVNSRLADLLPIVDGFTKSILQSPCEGGEPKNKGANEKIIRDLNAEICVLRNDISGIGTVKDKLRRNNHELMRGWWEKLRILVQIQVLLAHIYHSHNKRPCTETGQELYDKLNRRTLIFKMQRAATNQADQALYWTSQLPSDSQRFQDSPRNIVGNFPQKVRQCRILNSS